MSKFKHHFYQLLSSAFLIANCGTANAILNTDTTHISLEQSCETSVDTCFDKDSISTMLNWIWDTRQPDASSHLTVNIASGVYSMPNQLFCEDNGYVTFQGSGRENTILTGGLGESTYAGTDPSGRGETINDPPVVFIFNCANLFIKDLTIRANTLDSKPGSSIAVKWFGGGNAQWINVDLEGQVRGWKDKYIANTDHCSISNHAWFNSTISAQALPPSIGAVAYSSSGGASANFYQSEIIVNNTYEDMQVLAGMMLANRSTATCASTINFTLSTIRISTSTDLVTPAYIGGIYPVMAAYDSTINMSLGNITVIAETPGNNQDIYALSTGLEARPDVPGGYINALHMNYDLRSGGTITRLINYNDGVIEAPYQWPDSIVPPQIKSINGADTFVHINSSKLFTYNEECLNESNEPWISASGQCW